jgi:hypothetical protein
VSGKHVEPRPPYPELPAWEWPKPGQRTWTPPAKSYFGPCTGAPSCTSRDACPVGVVTTLPGGPHGCDCLYHDQRRGTP